MGQPVVHFEVMGKDAKALGAFYAGVFGWDVNTDNPMQYGVVSREDNLNAEGVGIGGGIGQVPEGYKGHVTFYVEVPDVETALTEAERLGGRRMMGPEEPMEGLVVGLFLDPEGHVVGVVKSAGQG